MLKKDTDKERKGNCLWGLSEVIDRFIRRKDIQMISWVSIGLDEIKGAKSLSISNCFKIKE